MATTPQVVKYTDPTTGLVTTGITGYTSGGTGGVNPTTLSQYMGAAASPASNIPGMPTGSPYQQGVTIQSPDPNNPGQSLTLPGNSQQFATDASAQALAQYLGGTVSQSQLTGPNMAYSTPMNMINVPGAPSSLNAGLVANTYAQGGSGPTSNGSFEIAQDLGQVPAGETEAQWALSNPNFSMDSTLSNSGPGYNMVYNPNTGTYTNTVTGQGGLSQTDAVNQMKQFNGLAGSAASPSGTATGGLGTGSGSTTGTGTTSTTPSWVPPGYTLNPTTGMLQLNTGSSQAPQSVNTPGSNTTTFGNNGSTVTQSSALNPATSKYSTLPSNYASQPGSNGVIGTSGLVSPADTSSGIAPNSQYSSTPGNGNPYSYLGTGYTTTDANGNPVYTPPQLSTQGVAGEPGTLNTPYTGPSLVEEAQNNRNIALNQGQVNSTNLSNYINYESGQDLNNQQLLNSAYAPIANGQGGYTPAQAASILDAPGLQSITSQLGADESNLNNAFSNTSNNVNSALATSQGAVQGAADTESQNLNAVTAATDPAINNAISQTAANISPYIDPVALNASSNYLQNETVSPQDEQNIVNEAGETIGNQALTNEETLMQNANAQGNMSPLALNTARERDQQQAGAQEAAAMTAAAVQAKQLQLQTLQQNEATRLGAAQNYANLGASSALAEGNQNVAGQEYQGQLGLTAASTEGAAEMGAEQYLGTQAQQAQQYLGSQAQTNAQNETGENLAAGEYEDTNTSNRQSAIANQAQTQEQEYRTYLQNQQAQANQDVAVGNQQQLTNTANTVGGANQATSVGVTNYGTKPGDPTSATNLATQTLGDIGSAANTAKTVSTIGNKKGGVSQGPHMALVGEAGPELIVDLADSSSPYLNKSQKSMPYMASGGVVSQGPEGKDAIENNYKVLENLLRSTPATWNMDNPPSYASTLNYLVGGSGGGTGAPSTKPPTSGGTGSPSGSNPTGVSYPPTLTSIEPPDDESDPTSSPGMLPVLTSFEPPPPGTSTPTSTTPDDTGDPSGNSTSTIGYLGLPPGTPGASDPSNPSDPITDPSTFLNYFGMPGGTSDPSPDPGNSTSTPTGSSTTTISYPYLPGSPSDPSNNPTYEPPDPNGPYNWVPPLPPDPFEPDPPDSYDALGEVVGGPRNHFFGNRDKLHGALGIPKSINPPRMELVDRPQIRMLGARVPQAVIPLTKRKTNKVNMGMLPSLLKKYGNYGEGVI